MLCVFSSSLSLSLPADRPVSQFSSAISLSCNFVDQFTSFDGLEFHTLPLDTRAVLSRFLIVICLRKCSLQEKRERRDGWCLYYSLFFFFPFFSNSELFHKHARQERTREMASLARFVLAPGRSPVWHSSLLSLSPLVGGCKGRRDRIFSSLSSSVYVYLLCLAGRREEQKTAKKMRACARAYRHASHEERKRPFARFISANKRANANGHVCNLVGWETPSSSSSSL